jgi:hypothetical protein
VERTQETALTAKAKLAGMWREMRERGDAGGYTAVKRADRRQPPADSRFTRGASLKKELDHESQLKGPNDRLRPIKRLDCRSAAPRYLIGAKRSVTNRFVLNSAASIVAF